MVRPCGLCGGPILRAAPSHWVRDGLEIVRCSGCGLVQRKVLPSEDELRRIYATECFAAGAEQEADGYLDYERDEPAHRRTAQGRLRRLLADREPGHLLDVGCAAGYFIDEAAEAGWQPLGIEISPEMSALARTRPGVEVETGAYLSSAQPGSFEVVTMWDYIEHTIDPLLPPGGRGALRRRLRADSQ